MEEEENQFKKIQNKQIWKTNPTQNQLITKSVTPFIVFAFYQYHKCLRFKLVSATKASNPKPQIEAPLLQQVVEKTTGSKWSVMRFVGAALFGLNSGIESLLMLVVILFNIRVFMVVVLGLAIGYLIVDMAKWVGWVGFGSGQSGLQVNRVVGQKGHF